MIQGYDELWGVFKLTDALDLGEAPLMVSEETLNFLVRYGGPNLVNFISDEEDDELEVTAEELEVIGLCDPAQQRWYEDKIDDILLGGDE